MASPGLGLAIARREQSRVLPGRREDLYQLCKGVFHALTVVKVSSAPGVLFCNCNRQSTAIAGGGEINPMPTSKNAQNTVNDEGTIGSTKEPSCSSSCAVSSLTSRVYVTAILCCPLEIAFFGESPTLVAPFDMVRATRAYFDLATGNGSRLRLAAKPILLAPCSL